LATFVQEVRGELDLALSYAQLTYFDISDGETEITSQADNQNRLITITSESNPQIIQLLSNITKDPVSVDENNKLVYDSKLMELGKLYTIKWDGNIIGLKKREPGRIDFYEFETDTE
jgi:hypothetical protein